MPPSRIELLQAMPIFGAIREDMLQLLLTQAHVADRRAGEYFFRENDQALAMFVLEAGRVSIVKQWKGREYVLNQLGRGDCFGEMALMDLEPRSASVRAEEDCHALEISAGDMLELFERDPEQFALLQMNIARELCRRLRATDERLFRAAIGDPAADAPHPLRTI